MAHLAGFFCGDLADRLGDGRLVCVYRRTDKPGLWASYARIAGDAWVNEGELALWGNVGAGAANIVGGENLSRAFTTLKFGLPAGLVMPDLFTTWLGFVAVVAFNGFLGHALLKSVHAAEHVLPPW